MKEVKVNKKTDLKTIDAAVSAHYRKLGQSSAKKRTVRAGSGTLNAPCDVAMTFVVRESRTTRSVSVRAPRIDTLAVT